MFILLLGSTYLLINRVNVFGDFPKGESRTYWLCLIFARSMGANLCFFAMMKGFLCLPLSLAIILFQTNPFCTAIFGRIINDETIYPFELIGMVLSFTGVCLLGLHSLREDIDDGEEIVHDTTKLLGIGLMIASAILFSMVCVVNRTLKDVHFAVIITWHGLFATTMALVIIFMQTVIMG